MCLILNEIPSKKNTSIDEKIMLQNLYGLIRLLSLVQSKLFIHDNTGVSYSPILQS